MLSRNHSGAGGFGCCLAPAVVVVSSDAARNRSGGGVLDCREGNSGKSGLDHSSSTIAGSTRYRHPRGMIDDRAAGPCVDGRS